MARRGGNGFRIALLFFCGAAHGHLDLYHHLEVSLIESDKITIFAMIHDTDLGDREFRQFLGDAYEIQYVDATEFEIDTTEEELPEGCRPGFRDGPESWSAVAGDARRP